MLPSAPIVAYPALASAILLTMSNVFMTIFYMGEPLKLDYLWAGLCLMGAVYFIFR